MTFDEWLYEVCEYIQIRTRKDMTDIYSSINLTDAKIAYMDNFTPRNYVISIKH